jgi:hypothetical protein
LDGPPKVKHYSANRAEDESENQSIAKTLSKNGVANQGDYDPVMEYVQHWRICSSGGPTFDW